MQFNHSSLGFVTLSGNKIFGKSLRFKNHRESTQKLRIFEDESNEKQLAKIKEPYKRPQLKGAQQKTDIRG